MNETLKPAKPPQYPYLHVKNGVIEETGEPATNENINKLTQWTKGFSIFVWNCRPTLCYGTENVKFQPPLTPKQEDRLFDILERELWRQGAAINFSGEYMISPEALQRIARLIGKRRLANLQKEV